MGAGTDEGRLPAEIQAVAERIELLRDPGEALLLLGEVRQAARTAGGDSKGSPHHRNWQIQALHAERKYGELLPPGERANRSWTRRLFMVPEDVLGKYLETAPSPTRSGLLAFARELEPESDVKPETGPAEKPSPGSKLSCKAVEGNGRFAPPVKRGPEPMDPLDTEIMRRIRAGEPVDYKGLAKQYGVGSGNAWGRVQFVNGYLAAERYLGQPPD